MKIQFEWIEPQDEFGRPTVKLLLPVVIQGFLIPAGFETDGFTFPWFVRAVYSPFGRGLRAAILHDYLLFNGELSRKECAEAFYGQLIEDQVDWRISKIMYLAVRAWDIRHA